MVSEKDKMLAGELYDANYDKELIKEGYSINVVAVGNPCRVIKNI